MPESCGLCIDGDLIEVEVLEETEGDRFDNDLKIHISKKVIEKGYDENKNRRFVQDAFIGFGTTGIERTKILDVTAKIMKELKIVSAREGKMALTSADVIEFVEKWKRIKLMGQY